MEALLIAFEEVAYGVKDCIWAKAVLDDWEIDW